MIFDKLAMELAADEGCVRREWNCGIMWAKGGTSIMPSIRTYARPVSNQVTIDIPREYASYSFEILLMPVRHESKKMGFVEFLRSAQVEDGELDLTRDHQDYPREVAL